MNEDDVPMTGVRWPSGFERRIGDQVVMGSNLAAATSLRNFWQFRLPRLPLPVCLEETLSRRFLLSGVYDYGYARGSKRSGTYDRRCSRGVYFITNATISLNGIINFTRFPFAQ